MPITVDADVRYLAQSEFGRIAYGVMDHVFAVHNEMGRFFDERIYRDTIAGRVSDSQTEVLIEVRFEDFCKEYYMDLLVEGGAIFEFKAVKSLGTFERSQLLNYLMHAGLSHGKMVNSRSELVEHEFVNTHLTLADRTAFTVVQRNWSDPGLNGRPLKPWMEDLLKDIGAGLDVHLYQAAVSHFLGGDDAVLQKILITTGGRQLGYQKLRMANPEWAFKVTTLADASCPQFEDGLRKFLNHTPLRGFHWINVTRHQVTFTTVEK